MIKIIRMIFWVTLGTLILSGCGPIQPSKTCPRTPLVETNAWDLEKVDEAFSFACEMGTTTLVIVPDGKVVRSMGDVTVPYHFFSLRKECRECGFVGNFMKSGFIPIPSNIIDARLPESL